MEGGQKSGEELEKSIKRSLTGSLLSQQRKHCYPRGGVPGKVARIKPPKI